jgi:hypothetical protein
MADVGANIINNTLSQRAEIPKNSDIPPQTPNKALFVRDLLSFPLSNVIAPSSVQSFLSLFFVELLNTFPFFLPVYNDVLMSLTGKFSSIKRCFQRYKELLY